MTSFLTIQAQAYRWKFYDILFSLFITCRFMDVPQAAHHQHPNDERSDRDRCDRWNAQTLKKIYCRRGRCGIRIFSIRQRCFGRLGPCRTRRTRWTRRRNRLDGTSQQELCVLPGRHFLTGCNRLCGSTIMIIRTLKKTWIMIPDHQQGACEGLIGPIGHGLPLPFLYCKWLNFWKGSWIIKKLSQPWDEKIPNVRHKF